MTGSTARGQCEATAFLPPALRTELLQTYPSVDRRLVADDLMCALEAHGGTGEHYAVLYDHFPSPEAGALWTRWRDGELPDDYWLRPDCTGRSPGGTACGHFLAHPGAHSWETEEPGS